MAATLRSPLASNQAAANNRVIILATTGDDVRVTRSGTGQYAVRFDGFGGNGTAGGNVQVSGYGSDSNHCKVSSWSSASANFVANVRCYNHAGALADARYSVQVTWH